ncbi:MAG TPA: DNA polymerase III subunit delta', partial [Salinimicrobium sp.]|nr:DNA polymerase III subunit delta' [Salinimicrobium sp.]
MLFSQVIGLAHIKNHLATTAENGRIPHAQIFVGKAGSGTLPMALAYARLILCGNSSEQREM